MFEKWFEKKKEGNAVNTPRRRPWFWIVERDKNASDEKFRKHTLKVLGKQGKKGRKRRWGRRKEKAMDGTNKECTSDQKTRWPSAIPDGFQSPLIAVWHQVPSWRLSITTP